ncbi:MAG: hypothetical protein DRP58_08705 [Spirochaetes bacterium]|nr:MAG: hypothetical protein DRP58_08705 [Spirochaetota bacterium]
MKKIKLLSFLIVIALISVVMSCEEFKVPGGLAIMKVDSNGHFKEDATYKDGENTQTYRVDGTFEEIGMRYEKDGEDEDDDGFLGEGWVPRYGNKGTYVYNPETMVMTWTLSSYWNREDTKEGAWGLYSEDENFVSKTNKRTQYFAESMICNVYFSDTEADTWVYNDIWTDVYLNDEDTEETHLWNYRETYLLSATNFKEKRQDWQTRSDSTKEELRGEWIRGGKIQNTFPANTIFEKGNTVTFQYIRDVDTSQDYNWDDDELYDVVDNLDGDLRYRSETFHHFGDFIVRLGSQPSRTLY